ncbi:MAG: hypothetical protein KC635_23325, partial [Myxococcales bacterium]|nr:hypothetical protein [Myxococcales bacterium]
LEPVVPAADGFVVVVLGRGVTVYRKDYAGGAPDWVTAVDLRVARVESVVGAWVGPPESSIEQRPMIAHWDDAVARGPALGARPRVLVNGAFFSPTVQPTFLTHGLQVAGEPVSYGYGLSEYPDHNAVVAWSNDTHAAAVLPWSVLAFEDYP